MVKVRDAMKTEVETVNPRMPVTEFERLLIEHSVSGFPVIDAGMLVGLVSRSDVVRALTVEHSYEEQLADYYRAMSPHPEADTAESVRDVGARVGARIDGMTVGDVMVKSVLTAEPDQSIADVARVLVDHGIHRLPVTEDGVLVGLVTTLDLARLIADSRVEVG